VVVVAGGGEDGRCLRTLVRVPRSSVVVVAVVVRIVTWENARNYIYSTSRSKVLESPVAPRYKDGRCLRTFVRVPCTSVSCIDCGENLCAPLCPVLTVG